MLGPQLSRLSQLLCCLHHTGRRDTIPTRLLLWTRAGNIHPCKKQVGSKLTTGRLQQLFRIPLDTTLALRALAGTGSKECQSKGLIDAILCRTSEECPMEDALCQQPCQGVLLVISATTACINQFVEVRGLSSLCVHLSA